MRTLNVRFLIILVLCVVAVGVGVHFVHSWQVSRYQSAFLREADRAEKEGRTKDAITLVRRYLAINPNDADVLARLSLMQVGHTKPDSAFMTLARALRLNPNREDLRRKLIEVALSIDRYPDAQTHIDVLLKTHPNDGRLLMQRARCQQATGNYAAAAKSANQAIRAQPSLLDAYLFLADLQRSYLERPQDAVATLDQMLAANPNRAEAYTIHGDYLMRYRMAPEVQAAVAQAADKTLRTRVAAVIKRVRSDANHALRLSPNMRTALQLAAQAAQQAGAVDQARALLQTALERYPEQPEVYNSLADLELHRQPPDQKAAIAWLRKGLDRVTTGRAQLLWNLANLEIDRNQVAAADDAIQQLQRLKARPELITFLQARRLVAEGKWLEASQQFENIRTTLADVPALGKQLDFWLGKCYREMGRVDLQLSAYHRAVGADGNWIPARLGMASALMALGRLDEAISQYQQVARLPDAPASVLLDLARLMILRNLRRSPSQQNWTAVSRALDQIDQLLPDSVQIPVLRAEMLVAQGKADEAKQQLVAAKKKHPDEVMLWTTLAELERRQRDWSAAEKVLGDARKRLGDHVEIRLAAARLAVVQVTDDKTRQKAAARLKALAKPDPKFTVAQQTMLWRELARAALSIKDYDLAEQLSNRVAASQPNNLRIRLLLLDLAMRVERTDVMQRVLKDVRRIEGAGPLWSYGEAVRLFLLAKKMDPKVPSNTRTELLQQALTLLTKARNDRPAWSRVPLLEAEIARLQNQTGAEISGDLQAIELGERHPMIIQRVVALLYQEQRFVEADQVLRRLQEQKSPFSLELARMARDISLRLDDFERALELAQQASANSKDFRDHIWLGQVLSVLGRNPEAEQAFRHAIKLAPQTPDTWIALVNFLMRTGQTAKAKAVVAEIQQTDTGKNTPLVLAVCYESIGDLKLAGKYFAETLKQLPNDPLALRRVADYYLKHGQLSAAEKLLRQIIARNSNSKSADIPGARRNLAAVLLTLNPGNRAEALKLVETNLAANPNSLIDLRTKALVLAAGKPKDADRKQAISLLESILKRSQRPAAEDRFLLAKLYLAEANALENDAKKARANQVRAKGMELLSSLIASNGDDARYLIFYIQQLIATGQPYEARLWLDKLQKLQPNAWITARTRAEVLTRLRPPRAEQAIQCLAAFAANTHADVKTPDERMRAMAAECEALAKTLTQPELQPAAKKLLGQAEQTLRKLAKNNPDQQMVLAAFLARHNQFDAAMTSLQKGLARKAPVNQIATVLAALTTGVRNDPSRLPLVEKQCRAAVTKYGQPINLLLTLANVLDASGKHDDAIRVYQKVLQKDPGNVTAANNVALIYAFKHEHLDEALALLDKAIQKVGPMSTLLDSRAVVQMALGHADQALRDAQIAVKNGPNATRWFHLAQALARNGQKSAAVAAVKRARKLSPQLDGLHPLERPAYQNLCRQLDI